MRNRFFFIILASLIFSAVGINLVHVYFFKSQRLNLIDRQISEASTLLLHSEKFEEAAKNNKNIEEAITKVLGGSRIGKVFVIRDIRDKIVYESFNVGLLQTALPTSPEWIVVETKNEYVRVRNIKLDGNQSLVLQVGLVLDRNLINWEILDTRAINYISGIVTTLFFLAVLLTIVLLSPLRLLISHLNMTTSNLVNLKDVEPLPLPLIRYTHGFWAKSDEFSGLVSTVQKLIDRINLNYKLTRSWTLQMAHELKTPLAIIRAETEFMEKNRKLPEGFAKDIYKEVSQMSSIINDFLDWAELESSRPQKDLHAIHISNALTSVISRLDKLHPGRIQKDLHESFMIFSNPSHFDQLVTNLLSNALKFSPPEKPVQVILRHNELTVQDFGHGIKLEIVEKVGEPFNIGNKAENPNTGNGLGLAWVSTIVRLYGWNLKFKTSPGGTEVTVSFPE